MSKTQKQQQSEQTQKKIITAATLLFVRKGFYGTSISALAQATDLTKGALYHHFENKDALFFAVIESIRAMWNKEVAQAVIKEKDALTQLNVLLDKHTRLTQQNNAICIVFNVLSIEMEGVNPQFSTAIKEIHTELVDFAEHIVKKGQRTGQFRLNLDSRLTAMNIVGILKVIGCSHVFYQMDVDTIAMTDTLKQILWEGVKK